MGSVVVPINRDGIGPKGFRIRSRPGPKGTQKWPDSSTEHALGVLVSR